ncbi:hypothetical protein EW146_g688 [Bondarzewia mesenterica]|uniref:Uncharacterized protein n=1 Tax=Bondarzewia mesenterica TaxID=1095465 RepID=A0A4S4M6N5_9AGAM|nr:hypothetical protein EW146_g688 [Bondarzewia mesenterica]
MFSKSFVAFVAFSVLTLSEPVVGRMRWIERNGRAVLLNPRRFGQEHPAVIDKLGAACPGQVCGVLSGQAITPLLAAQGECTQQDMADAIIDAAKQFDATIQANMIALAQEYRQAEKNTPPDFTTNPPTNRNSVFCQKAPKNAELNGLVQAQDPANDPDLFFDPATNATVKKGDQANTFPFVQSDSSASSAATTSTAVPSTASSATSAASSAVTSAATAIASVGNVDVAAGSNSVCPTAVTVTAVVTATADSGSGTTTSASSAAATSTAAASAIGNFGSCSVPQIEFGVGFDNRKETSFEPVDKTSYNHGSAQNIDIITQFICDTLTNSCGADATAKATCATATAASNAQTAKTGAQADVYAAFNAAFGITTDFAAVASVDDQGNIIAGTGSSTSSSASASSASASSAGSASSGSASAAATTTIAAAASTASASNIGSFGSCSVPQIKFGVGFDNRKETSFEPVDQTSYNHGSAQNIDIITQFICDTLTNSCGADANAKATCATATAASKAQTAETGAQADAFNAGFGITTDFASVAAVDNQGNVIASNTGSSSVSASSAAASATSGAATTAAATSTSSSTAAVPTNAAVSTSGNLQTFTGALGGVTAPAVTDLGSGQFQVDGNSAFNNKQNALVRSCDVQHNQCANAANASGNKGDLTVAACGTQQTQCAAQATASA